MASFHSLPGELIHFIIDLLSSEDAQSALSLLQTCKSLFHAVEYNRVRYQYLRQRHQFPLSSKFPYDVRHEANLLHRNQWPQVSKNSEVEANGGNQSRRSLIWNEVPSIVPTGTSSTRLSKQARLIGDQIYDVTSDAMSLYMFQIQTAKGISDGDASCKEELSKPVILRHEFPILSYDADFDEGVLVVLTECIANGLRLFVYRCNYLDFTLIRQEDIDSEFNTEATEVQVNGASILVSLGNSVKVYDWKMSVRSDSKANLGYRWKRECIDTRADGWYVRATLLSPDVVSCIVLQIQQTIGSIITRQSWIELFRLDQYVPFVAKIVLPERMMDALQPRLLQAANQYISIDIGGKKALEDALSSGYDGPAVIQTFSVTVSVRFEKGECGVVPSLIIVFTSAQRVGTLSSLCEILYPKAAVALFSSDPSQPSYPILKNEWLQRHFPAIRDVLPLQTTVHGQRVVSSARRAPNRLIFWGLPSKGEPSQAFQPTSQPLQGE
jgi:hypothetical protein